MTKAGKVLSPLHKAKRKEMRQEKRTNTHYYHVWDEQKGKDLGDLSTKRKTKHTIYILICGYFYFIKLVTFIAGWLIQLFNKILQVICEKKNCTNVTLESLSWLVCENCLLDRLLVFSRKRKRKNEKERKHLLFQLSKNSRCHFLQYRKWVDCAWGSRRVSAGQTVNSLCKHDSIPPAVQRALCLQTYHTTFIFPPSWLIKLSPVKISQRHSRDPSCFTARVVIVS